MEEEAEDEEGKEEETRKEADRNQWESQAYCPFSSFSSLSLSCMATLPELLHRWCSAKLAKERLRSLRRKNQTQTHTPLLTHTPPLDAVPDPTPSQEVLPVTEKALETVVLPKGQNEDKPLSEVHTVNDTYTPDFSILLEPSRASTIPPQSFSDSHSSLTQPTPTNEEKVQPSVKDAALDPLPTPPLPAVSIPETQQDSRATPTPTVNFTPHPQASEEASSAFEDRSFCQRAAHSASSHCFKAGRPHTSSHGPANICLHTRHSYRHRKVRECPSFSDPWGTRGLRHSDWRGPSR